MGEIESVVASVRANEVELDQPERLGTDEMLDHHAVAVAARAV
jgi:hypothetical protein